MTKTTTSFRCSCHLHSTWLAFTASAVHPALASRRKEAQYLEAVASRLIGLLVPRKLSQSNLLSR